MHDTPTIFVIFGITGDLAQRKLLPALLSLYSKKLLPPRFSIVGFGRRVFTKEDFRQFVRDEMNIKAGEFKGEDVKHFLDHILYQQGFFDKPEAYQELAKRLKLIDDQQFKQCSNKLFHLSVPPALYKGILNNLADSGLTIPCGGDLGWTRVLVEKPFGSDVETAQELDKLLGKLFEEEQIFRIDHYLAKETLQNVLAFRFANALFEPLWNHRYIERVELKLLEKIDVEGRGAFYDSVGALKDVGQNHLLQMLALVAMEQPAKFEAAHIRKERSKVLRDLAAINHRNIAVHAVRGQYDGYTTETGVVSGSQTETYFKIRAFVNTPRWKHVPFILESGKAVGEGKALINIYFKDPNNPGACNMLRFRIQPNEAIEVKFWMKSPGLTMDVESKTLKFDYTDFAKAAVVSNAYEKVLFDAITGDQTLFTSTDEVIHAWEFITPIIESWSRIPLMKYKKGTLPNVTFTN